MSAVATPRVRGRGWLLASCLVWVGVLLLVPLVGIVITALKPGIHVVTETLRAPDVIHALELTAVITVISVVVTALFGVVVAWVLVRQRFWGRSLMNATVCASASANRSDLPRRAPQRRASLVRTPRRSMAAHGARTGATSPSPPAISTR